MSYETTEGQPAEIDPGTGIADLSYGRYHQMGHLTETAILTLACDNNLEGDEVFVVPSLHASVPSLQRYVLAAAGTFTRHVDAIGADLGAYMAELVRPDSPFQEGEHLPPGVMILRNGEAAHLGRRTSPHMGFSEYVSRHHMTIMADNRGLQFDDMFASNGSLLALADSDMTSTPASPEGTPVDPELRQKVLEIFSEIPFYDLDGIDEKGLKVDVTTVQADDSPLPVIELVIEQADNYTALQPIPGYDSKKITVDPSRPGIASVERNREVSYIRPGIVRATLFGSLETAEAEELLRLGHELYYRATD